MRTLGDLHEVSYRFQPSPPYRPGAKKAAILTSEVGGKADLTPGSRLRRF
jgi:hypothetical protein